MKILVIEEVEIELVRKKIKNMYLRVKAPDGRIQVNAPMKMSEDYIVQFIKAKMEWIIMQQERIRRKEENKIQEFCSDEKVLLLGEEYRLKVVEQEMKGKPYINIEEHTIYLYTGLACGEEERRMAYVQWSKDLLRDKLEPMILHWEEIIGVKSLSWYIRDMKTCWGTCNVVKKRLCFNLQLINKAPELIEYVVVHELVHLLERSHNQRFKNFMSTYIPDWKLRKARLNDRNISML